MVGSACPSDLLFAGIKQVGKRRVVFGQMNNEKNKKILYVIYIAAVLILAVFPFAGMSVASTDETTENKELAELPKLKEDGKWNVNYLSDLGGYFEEHFALRQELVAANALLRGKVMGVSASDQVVVGRNGWLYYGGTLNDYFGEKQMSARGLANGIYNTKLMQEYIEGKGSKFVLTIAPNKNSVYSDDMPSNYLQGKENNYSRIVPLLREEGIHFVELSEMFRASKEPLYLQEDSHWNNKGAVLVCRRLMDALGRPYDISWISSFEVRREHIGDLANMLYSVAAQPEDNLYYDRPQIYAYVNDVKSVEDDWIETINPNGRGSVLMFRDSFGNSLLPFLANEFEHGYFSRLIPYNLGNLEEYHVEYVVVERVERRISFFAEQPPVMEGPIRKLNQLAAAATDTTVSVKPDGSWYVVEGILDSDYVGSDTEVYVSVRADAGGSATYEAFHTSVAEEDGWNDYGYKLYLKGTSVPKGTVYLDVILTEGDTQVLVTTQEVTIKEEETQ